MYINYPITLKPNKNEVKKKRQWNCLYTPSLYTLVYSSAIPKKGIKMKKG